MATSSPLYASHWGTGLSLGSTLSIDPQFIQYYQGPPKKTKAPNEVTFQDLRKGDIIRQRGSWDELYVIYNDGRYIRAESRGSFPQNRVNLEANDQPLGKYGWQLLNREVERETPKKKAPAKGVTFDDVILPKAHKQAILDAVKQVDNHKLIFEEWGFEDTLEKGRAVSMLFHGPPGTGKTLTAQAIANHLGYKLKVVGTAEIESSEPGQAERNLKNIFKQKEGAKPKVILLDECDSLIADRRSVGMILGAQINTLLQCLENYEGVVILTTNRLEKMDEALNRRLSLKLEFALPSLEERVKIWKRLFPKKAPVAKNIRWEELASVELAGGYIKNVVLRAARRAANTKARKITHQILVDALIEEVEAMVEFDTAVQSNTTPRLIGEDYRKGV